MSKISIVFFGTPDIGLKSLEYLYNSEKIDVLAVVTQPDRPAGRGHKIQMSPIKVFALDKEIPVFFFFFIRKGRVSGRKDSVLYDTAEDAYTGDSSF